MAVSNLRYWSNLLKLTILLSPNIAFANSEARAANTARRSEALRHSGTRLAAALALWNAA